MSREFCALRKAFDEAELVQPRVLLIDCTHLFEHGNECDALQSFASSRLLRCAFQIVQRTPLNQKVFDRLVTFLKTNRVVPTHHNMNIGMICACGTSIGMCSESASIERIVDLGLQLLCKEVGVSTDSATFTELVHEVELVHATCSGIKTANASCSATTSAIVQSH